MASTTSLLTGLSGLNANSRRLEVIGNNISNINTTAYKSNTMHFAPALSRNFSLGTAPSASNGGTNPGQVGLGVKVAGTQRNFNNGAIATTGVNTDLALEGNGFFIVERGDQQFYSRAGAFQLNSQRDLVTISGERVKGYSVDDNFNIVEGQLVDLNIPVGSLTIAEATRNVEFQGNLNANVNGLPTQGSLTTFDQLFLSTAMGNPPLVGTDTLVDTLGTPADPTMAQFPAANAPYQFTIAGAQKGTRTVPTQTLEIDAMTTVNDLINFINDVFGIVPGLTNPDGSTSGAQIDGAGQLTIVGNTGESNNITLEQGHISIRDMNNVAVTNPFTLSQNPLEELADGESVRTTFIIYDSLGAPVQIDLTMVFEEATNEGTTWRFFVDSADNLDPMDMGLNIGTGVVSFDNFGQLIDATPVQIQVQRQNTGAVTPLVFSLNFSSGQNAVSALVDANPDADSAIAATFQDGLPIGTLATFSFGEDGRITGSFTNGVTRTIGQVAVANFTNPEGLVDSGNNLFSAGPNSGNAIVTTPQNFGTGRLIGAALEQSNVDLGAEFTNLILTTTGYSAASRVITTTDQLLQLLVSIGR
ncbi:MAG: flagellar hook-basal body complex protein [Phycisphaeraceae bacterium]|nr:MAG: flagellar hook-basal body complex protein [Phycisphaeraceae bacterium]